MKFNFLFGILLSLTYHLHGQAHADCSDALIICDKTALKIEVGLSAGANVTELNDASCFSLGIPGNVEANSFWIKFKVKQSGNLLFTIIPDQPEKDYDFVFYEVSDSSCTQKTLLRCMASGEGWNGLNCLGATGLQYGETDVSEHPGCSGADNGFLAPVDLNANSTYALAIMNFSGFPNDSVVVQWCGTALLSCDDYICYTTSQENVTEKISVGVFNNPATASDGWDIRLQDASSTDIHLYLYDFLGILRKTYILPAGAADMRLDANGLQPGRYVLSAQTAYAGATRILLLAE